jgi:hypothetical protein
VSISHRGYNDLWVAVPRNILFQGCRRADVRNALLQHKTSQINQLLCFESVVFLYCKVFLRFLGLPKKAFFVPNLYRYRSYRFNQTITVLEITIAQNVIGSGKIFPHIFIINKYPYAWVSRSGNKKPK